MGVRFQPSQYSNATVQSTGEEIPFVLKRYRPSGPGVFDDLSLRDEFDTVKDAAGDLADDVLAEDKPLSQRPITYIALGAVFLAAYMWSLRKPAARSSGPSLPVLSVDPVVVAKYRKVRELARRGSPGERDNARRIMADLEARYSGIANAA